MQPTNELDQAKRKRRWYQDRRLALLLLIPTVGFSLMYVLAASQMLRATLGSTFFGVNKDSSVYFREPQRLFTTKERPYFGLESENGERHCRLSIYKRPSYMDAQTEGRIRGLHSAPYWMTKDQIWNQLETATPVQQITADLSFVDYAHTEGLAMLSQPLPPGDYLIAVYPGADASHSGQFRKLNYFRVTDIGLVVKQSADHFLIEVLDLNSGKPRPDVPFKILDYNEANPFQKETAHGRTDSRGLAFVKLPHSPADGNFNVAAEVDGSRALFSTNYLPNDWEVSNTPSAQGYFSYNDRSYFWTDRTVYRLGQTVNFRAFLANVTDTGVHALPAGSKVIASIRDPGGNQIWVHTFKTDGASTLNGSFEIPPTAQTGASEITLDFGNNDQATFAIQVEQYRKPEYEVTIEPVTPNTVANGKAHCKVKAKYYFGAPVTNAKVDYTANFTADWNTRLRLLEQPSYCRFYDMWNQNSYAPDSQPTDVTKQGSVFTNDKGEAFVDVALPKLEGSSDPAEWANEHVNRNLSVDATVTDLSRKTVSASSQILVPAGAFDLAATAESGWVSQGQKLLVSINALDHSDKPVSNQTVSVRLVKRHQKWFSDKYDQEPIASTSINTNATGKARFTLQLPKEAPVGDAILIAVAKDSAGNTIEDRTSVWITGSRPELVDPTKTDESVKVLLDKPAYTVQETAQLTINDPLIKAGQVRYALITVQAAGIYDYKVVELHAPITTVPMRLREAYYPNAYIDVIWLQEHHKIATDNIELKVYPKDKLLNVKVAAGKPVYRPGDQAEFTLSVRKANGEAAANTAVSFALTDESIFAIKEESSNSIDTTVYTHIDDSVGKSWTFNEYAPNTVPPLSAWQFVAWPIFSSEEHLCRERALHESGAFSSSMSAGRGGNMPPPPAACLAPPMLQGATNGTIGPQGGDASIMAPTPKLRTDFKDTAAWVSSVVTDGQGNAKVKIKLPDNLTAWRASAVACNSKTEVGHGNTKVTVSRDLLARLALPRFYTEGDETVLTGLVHNYTKQPQNIQMTLNASGNFKSTQAFTQSLTVAPGEVGRYSWPVVVSNPGEASVTLKTIGQTDADALVLKLPVRDFGYTEFFAKTGVLDKDHARQDCSMRLPADGDIASARYNLALSGSRIGPVLGNFDKLIQYPYGCTEQTMSRLIPSVVALRLHRDLGLPLSAEKKEMFDKVYHIAIVKLLSYQNENGGWGWWQHDHSNPYLTAYVLEGAYMLRNVGYTLDKNMIDNGLNCLKRSVSPIDLPLSSVDFTDRARVQYVLALYGEKSTMAGKALLMTPKDKSSPEGLAYLTLAFKQAGDFNAAKSAYERLSGIANESMDFVDWDHSAAMYKRLGMTDAYDYDYRFTGAEATSLGLRATLKMEPNNDKRIDMIRRWILLQRDQNGWNDTKTTSSVFIALLEDELSKGKVRTDFTSAVKLKDKVLAEATFNGTDAYGPEKVFPVAVKTRDQILSLEKNGPGRLYFASMLTCRRRLQPGKHLIPKAIPMELRATRQFFRFEKRKDKTVSVPLKEGDSVKAGESIMMRVFINSPVALPYVKVEAFLPSGAEITSDEQQYRSPYEVVDVAPKNPGEPEDPAVIDWWWTHQDVLDDRVVFFTTSLPAGRCAFTSLMRMEMPGTFNVNPVSIEGMYTNKVRAYSDADRIKVVE